MTAATYTSDLTDIFLFETTTGISAYGGGGAGLGAAPDFAMEGTNAVDKQVKAADKGMLFDSGSSFTIGTNDHFFIWIMGATPGLNDTRDNGGIVVGIGDSTSDFVKFHVDGSDTLPLGGGKVYALRFVNTALANLRTLVGSPGTAPSVIGGGLKGVGTVKGVNLGVDAARIGTGYDILNGTGADPEADFAGIASDDESTSEGVFQSAAGGYTWQGKLRIGSASTACEFLDSDVLLGLRETLHCLSDFTEIIIEHASTIVNLTRVTFLALDTGNKGRFEVLTSAAVVNLTSCTFQQFGVTILGTGSTFSSCNWIGCGIITANGADLTGSAVSEFGGASDTSPVIWDTATDPDGFLDAMTYTKGSASTHGIELGTTSPLSMTFRDTTTSGYNASDAATDSFFHVLRTSGTVTINIIRGTGNFSYKSEGATVLVIVSPVTATVKVINATDASDIEGAIVLVWADSGGDLPADASITGITRSGSVATATTSVSHGLTTGDEVLVEGADQADYNGPFAVTVTGASEFTYTVANSPTQPATGTIIFSSVIINNAKTNASGIVTDTRTYTNAQPVTGFVRKGTAPPVYVPSAITGTIDNSSDTTLTISLAPD